MSIVRELYYGARTLRATPLFTIASVTILALGIGATSAVFSVVNGLLLRPLPVHDPDRLVRVWKADVNRGSDHAPLTYPEYLYWEERATRFESLATLWSWGPTESVWTIGGEARRIYLEKVSTNFFDVLGVEPVYGRTFVPDDEHRTALPPVLLSYRVFSAHFGEDSSILGETLPILNGVEVVGILPPEFQLSSSADAYVPTLATDPDWANGVGCECDLIGRVRHDASPDEARAELQTIHERHAQEYAAEGSRPIEVVMTPLLETVVGDAGTASLLMFVAVCLLLAIAIVNLAALFLTRTAKRQHELAVRAAIGAGRRSLIRQMVVESVLIAGLGLLGGWLIAYWGVSALLTFGSADLPRADQIEVDYFVLAFSALLGVAATMGFGLWPALRAARVDVVHSLRGKTVGLVNTRLVGHLVVLEISIAFVLLVVSSLLVRSLNAAQSVERGFRTENLISIGIRLPSTKYSDVNDRFTFHERLLEEVKALPGVLGATPTFLRPGRRWEGFTATFRFEGQTEEDARQNPWVSWEWAGPDHFRILGVPILQGRAFTETDRMDSEQVVIVSESIADRYWPGEDPVGKWVGHPKRFRVVGVAADTQFRELRRYWDSVYFPVEQFPFGERADRHPFSVPRHLLVHTALAPDAALPSILDRVRNVDVDVPLDDVATFEALVERELARPRFHAFLSSAFSFAGLLLALTGIYGVVASYVAQRLREAGLRTALGASPWRLRSWIVAGGMRIALLGLAVGVVLAIPAVRLTRSLLYGVSAGDVTNFVSVAVVLVVVCFVTIHVAARGASLADPMTLLRNE